MTPKVDIFRVETGGVRWVEAVATLEGAKARVQELAGRSPGEYFLLDQETGNKLVIKVAGTDRGSDRGPEARQKEIPMGDEELPYPEWQAPFEEMTVELDREKLRGKVQDVENLIFTRVQQLSQMTGGRSEREAINEALSILRTIKRDKLGYPDW